MLLKRAIQARTKVQQRSMKRSPGRLSRFTAHVYSPFFSGDQPQVIRRMATRWCVYGGAHLEASVKRYSALKV